jgi:hypothetical protein
VVLDIDTQFLPRLTQHGSTEIGIVWLGAGEGGGLLLRIFPPLSKRSEG